MTNSPPQAAAADAPPRLPPDRPPPALPDSRTPDPERRDAPRRTSSPLDFDTFYRTSYDGVAGALTLTLGDRELGREAADEAMVRALERWERIGGYDNPGGWVYRVGLNWARSLRRRLRREWPLSIDRPHEDPPISDPSIAAALQKLPLHHRSVVVCRLLLDWSTDETAAALRVRPGTVKSRLHRALATIETHLEDLR